MRLLIDNVLLFDGDNTAFSQGSLLCGGGRVIRRDGRASEADSVLDAGGAYLIPGLVDIHTHGRAGYDFSDTDGDGLKAMAAAYLHTGVTTVVPTLASAPYESLIEAADRINASRDAGGARFIGMHLEGRYLNPAKRGVQAAELLAAPDIHELEELTRHAQLPFHITFAPELDADGEFLRRALKLGLTVAAGHTAATYEQASDAQARGVSAYSHTFNAMPPLHHRAGGAVCAALTGNAYCELICDGMHIAPEMVKLAYSCTGSGRLVLVSDSMAGTGCPDGIYPIAGVPVTVKDGRALSADGTLGGSTLDLFDGVKNLMKFCGIELEDAVRCATLNPARALGIDNEVGSLEPGCFADALLVRMKDGVPELEKILLGGEPV